jgi:hypothetical protein
MYWFMSKRTVTHVALVVILLVGLFLRLWRLDFGMELPYLAHTDEPTQYNPAVNMIKTGDLNPHFFNYPSLTIYLDALVMYVGFWLGRFVGVFESWADLQSIRTLHMSVGIVGTPAMLLLGRATTAVMGTLTLALVFGVTQPLAKRRWPSLFAAFLLAISMAHIRLSHYMTVDVIATFFAIATVMLCTLALARGTASYASDVSFLWGAALCGGLATSSKYNYAVLALPVGLSGMLDFSVARGIRVKRVLLSGLIFCLAFVLTSPYVLLDCGAAFKAIQHEMRHYATGHLGVTGSSFVWYFQYLWEVNPFYVLLGIPGLALALFCRRVPAEDVDGAGHSAYRWFMGTRVALPAVTFTLVYFGLIGRQVVHFDRNVLPILVMLIIGVSIAVGRIVRLSVEIVGGGLTRKWPDWGAFGCILLSASIVLAPIVPSWVSLPALLRPPAPSGKALAQGWFAQVLETSYGQRYLSKAREPTLRIAAEPYTVYLDPATYAVKYIKTVSAYESGWLYFTAKDYDIVILGSGMFERFYKDPATFAREVRIYDDFFEALPSLAFQGPDDPLAFRKNGTDVYVFFLTGRAAVLVEEMGGILPSENKHP